MTISNGNAEILGEYAGKGFSLEAPDDHILILKHRGEEIAKFSQTGATTNGIQSLCATHLVEIGEDPLHTLKYKGVTGEVPEDLDAMRRDMSNRREGP